MDERTTKIEALKTNKVFIEKLLEAKSNEDIIAVFADEGIEVTEKEILAADDMLTSDGELNEKALENVSGGWVGVVIGIAAVLAGASAARGLADGLKCRK